MFFSPLTTVFWISHVPFKSICCFMQCWGFFYCQRFKQIGKEPKNKVHQQLWNIKYVNRKCICIISLHEIRCILRQTYKYLSVRVTDKHFNSYSRSTFPLEYHCRFSAQICITVEKICQTALYWPIMCNSENTSLAEKY